MARMENSIVAKSNSNQNQKFSVAIQGNALQGLIAKSTPDAQAAARLTGSLIAAVSETPKLSDCTPASIVAAALRGEGFGLMLGQGYYIIPYGDTAKASISYKGLIQMAIAGGDVADMDCVEVREGEYVGRDNRTKRPKFDFSVYETDEEAEKHKVVGYYAYIEKRDGFFRSEYMSLNAILDHAERYSKSFDREKYMKLVSGELTPEDADKLMEKSPWYSSTEIMMKKTVIRRLLNSGYVVLNAVGKIQQALAVDDENTSAENTLASFDVVNVDEKTGELREQTTQIPTQEAATDTQAVTTPPEPKKRGRKPQSAHDVQNVQDVDFAPVKEDTDDGVIGSIFD